VIQVGYGVWWSGDLLRHRCEHCRFCDSCELLRGRRLKKGRGIYFDAKGARDFDHEPHRHQGIAAKFKEIRCWALDQDTIERHLEDDAVMSIRSLIKAALAEGGHDNISVVIVDFLTASSVNLISAGSAARRSHVGIAKIRRKQHSQPQQGRRPVHVD
jgi:hypothetical protein